MSDYTKLPRDIADCMSRAGSPLSEDQKLILAGYLAPVQEDLAKAKEENERVRQANLHTMDVFEDMKAAKEKAEARVAELEADNLHQRERRNAARDCIKKMSLENKAVILRKQAGAVEIQARLWNPEDQTYSGRKPHKELIADAQSLRQKADEAERAGGEK